MDWVGVLRSVLVWFGAERTGLVWCSAVVDVLIVGRDITTTHNVYAVKSTPIAKTLATLPRTQYTQKKTVNRSRPTNYLVTFANLKQSQSTIVGDVNHQFAWSMSLRQVWNGQDNRVLGKL
jgi:hypothetical protein